MAEPFDAPRIWEVGALCRAIADALEARFNPVTVRGELTGFSRAASGHCYLSLKDSQGLLRCAMFRRAASLLDFEPRDGELVEIRGRLGVYEPRGELQLIVESMRRAGQGTLFEEFLRVKAKLDSEGLFAATRKRELPPQPRGIGVVTSLGAAALHDVVTALRRRVPHIPVVLSPASVQGAGAPAELVRALSNLYLLTPGGRGLQANPAADRGPVIDLILLVRGGGSMEDLWAFNDEQLARTIARSPVPVISGVGHETDFTIADFVADLRAPTPTAAAELAVQPREVWLGVLDAVEERVRDAIFRHLDGQAQRLDQLAARLGRPSGLVARQQQRLSNHAQRLRFAVRAGFTQRNVEVSDLQRQLPRAVQFNLERATQRVERAGLRLGLLDPSLVLQRGYAWLADESGKAVTSVTQTRTGQRLNATLADGEVDLTVNAPRLI